MSRIFISYRRDDSAGYAGRLYDRLSERFGQGKILMDIDTRLFGISRGKATYGSTPIRQIGDSPQGQGKGVGIEL